MSAEGSDGSPSFDGSRLFAALDQDGRQRLMRAAKRVEQRPGALILREGDEPSAMFVLLRGELRVTASRLDGTEVELRTLKPGAVFGEIGVLTGEPRTATVTALTDVWLMELSVDAVREITSDYPDITGDLMRLGIERTEETLAEVMRGDPNEESRDRGSRRGARVASSNYGSFII
ncbi:MAG: cyclic nucleotide-binding domain-containing protein [Myxococcales bacterium]|nr:cyclic nucleotide-binding domain-containing protein [Myxococcales bacterium]